MSADSLLVSVVIPTRNRRALVKQAIDSFCRQTLAPECFEVIVIDNSSDDDTAGMVAEAQTHVPFQLIFHRSEVNRGAVASRNTGARMARAPLIGFTDSDCEVSPDWLALAVEAFRKHPDAAFLTGPVVNKPNQKVTFFSLSGGNGLEDPIYPTCNLFYTASVFWKVGAFDESVYRGDIGTAPLECSDADIAWRVLESGYRNLFVPGMIVYHEVRRVTPWIWLAGHARVMFIPELVSRHAGLRKKLLWWGPVCLPDNLLFYAGIAGVVLSFFHGWWFALAAFPFLIRSVRVVWNPPVAWRLPRIFVQVGFLIVRHAVITGALLYGSVRARKLVI